MPSTKTRTEIDTGEELVLADGSHVAVRPISPDDFDGFARGFERLSEESRYRRFLSPKPSLSRRELKYLTHVDHVCHEALVAYDPRDGELLGVARYATDGSPGRAEMAVAIADQCQAMGLGTALATRVVERARQNGIVSLTATSLRSNGPSRALMRHLGFQVRTHDGPTVELELSLADRRRRTLERCPIQTSPSPRSTPR